MPDVIVESLPPKKQPASSAPSRNIVYLYDETQSLIYSDIRDAGSPLPLPSAECMQYGETPENHLASGKADADMVRSILAGGGFDIGGCKRFLDWGCSNGRVLRHFADWAQKAEGWGVDINAVTAMWASTHLRPPFHCLATTSAPHLPFGDDTFGLIYGLSIFTHIDDLFPAWIAELARVTEPNGYVLLTIHDEATVALLQSGQSKHLGDLLFQNQAFPAYAEGKAGMISLRRGKGCQVFFKRSFFCQFLADHFDVVSVTEQAMVKLQTGILARRRAR